MSTYNPLQERGLIITMAKGSRGGRRSGGGSVSQSHTGATVINGGGMADKNKKSSPKDYGRWDKVGIVITSKPKQQEKQQTTKKKVKKGK